MYDKNNTMDKVDEARLDLFAWKQRPYDGIPPTSTALMQHVISLSTKQAAYGARQQCAKCKLKVLLTGDGRKVNLLDDPSTYCPELSPVNKMWLQDGMPRAM
ncbi:hypothetical protein Pmani_000971 [Petrolisthes manimaculis]|uniref:Uncharacterized protein n=1 Tax=Petrolisthes manimaculis TaxID=1843537 RepID=A0AAE1QN68_9EUCA|nr:hypothetical protein Pmani_000971 [Petrolisthes manimaculis]